MFIVSSFRTWQDVRNLWVTIFVLIELRWIVDRFGCVRGQLNILKI